MDAVTEPSTCPGAGRRDRSARQPQSDRQVCANSVLSRVVSGGRASGIGANVRAVRSRGRNEWVAAWRSGFCLKAQSVVIRPSGWRGLTERGRDYSPPRGVGLRMGQAHPGLSVGVVVGNSLQLCICLAPGEPLARRISVSKLIGRIQLLRLLFPC